MHQFDSFETPQAQAVWQQALAAFNNGHYYHCHELLEEAFWYSLPPGPQKQGLQALIQLAVAYHHWQTGNLNGANRLFNKVLDKQALLEALCKEQGLSLQQTQALLKPLQQALKPQA